MKTYQQIKLETILFISTNFNWSKKIESKVWQDEVFTIVYKDNTSYSSTIERYQNRIYFDSKWYDYKNLNRV